MRIGHGYDVHKLVEGRKCIIGGVDIPFEKGLLGHSDADVLTHAIMDSLLGAAALGDIGKQFPDNDPETLGISSLVLLDETAQIIFSKTMDASQLDRPRIVKFKRVADEPPKEVTYATKEDLNALRAEFTDLVRPVTATTPQVIPNGMEVKHE